MILGKKKSSSKVLECKYLCIKNFLCRNCPTSKKIRLLVVPPDTDMRNPNCVPCEGSG